MVFYDRPFFHAQIGGNIAKSTIFKGCATRFGSSAVSCAAGSWGHSRLNSRTQRQSGGIFGRLVSNYLRQESADSGQGLRMGRRGSAYQVSKKPSTERLPPVSNSPLQCSIADLTESNGQIGLKPTTCQGFCDLQIEPMTAYAIARFKPLNAQGNPLQRSVLLTVSRL